MIAILGALCLLSTVAFSEQCGNVGASPSDQQTIVSMHNKIRTSVQTGSPQLNDANGQPLPRAVNMKMLKWDNKLAKAAGKMTKTCKFEHFVEQIPEFKQSGQNIFTGGTSNPNACSYADAINLWNAEISDYGNDQRRPYVVDDRFNKTGHFTQVIWAQTSNIGCACSVDAQNNQFIACNYGFSGNVKSMNGIETSIYDIKGEKPTIDLSTLIYKEVGK